MLLSADFALYNGPFSLGLSIRSRLLLTLCCQICRTSWLPSVEFSFSHSVSIPFLLSIRCHFNDVYLFIRCKFSPCVQGSVSGFFPFLNVPPQVCPFNSTIQLSRTSLHIHARTSFVHYSHFDCAIHELPLCLILAGFHPYAPSTIRYYLTSDTMLLLLQGNLLVTVIVGRVQFCFNYKCGGVSYLQLNFQGTRRFSVQPHPLPSL